MHIKHVKCIFENEVSTLCETKIINLGNSGEILGNSGEIRWKAFHFFSFSHVQNTFPSNLIPKIFQVATVQNW